MTLLLLGEPASKLHHTTSEVRLLTAVLVSIAAIVLLITRMKMHPFLSLLIGSGILAAVASVPFDKLLGSFVTGFGSTIAGVGLLIGLGAMLGRLLADSGGADVVADHILRRSSIRSLPWAVALVAAVLGLPLFFEVGVVLLVPIVLLVVRRGNMPLLRIGIPALAGISVLHGLVPPHPGPLVAVDALRADLGVTLALGMAAAVPTLIMAGPLYACVAERWVGRLELPATTAPIVARTQPMPRFGAVLGTILLPVTLMLAKALADVIIGDQKALAQRVFDVIGSPLVALLTSTLVAMVTLGRASGLDRAGVSAVVEKSLGPIAGIVFIVGAGGGFKQTLIDVGVGDAIGQWSENWRIPALFLGWLIAVLIRLATGSATVAIITAAGIVSPLTVEMATAHISLLVLAIGAGSLFFSHVNDAGFWLVKEYFGMSVSQTLKSWSVMETIISMMGLLMVLILSTVV
ncbi:GntP family permease [Mycobacteroides abscessus]|uniref:GntP family permease n=1 Tax=Mycobacteroides abscessus TaxID=36809 RepID=UPI002103A7B2|nr:gluconate:H+ symporter [Mycobacteroides abscessus]